MKNKIKLYNGKSLKIEEFDSLIPGRVSMYVCGPTVYNYAHIGNARPIVVFDTLKMLLQANGYQVDYISNVTDVDDKIIAKALAEGVGEEEIAERYLRAYLKLRKDLNTQELQSMPRVTLNMEAIIAFIKLLLEEGYAYIVDGDVYFRVGMIKDYGEFSHQNPEKLEVGARVDENDKKENPLDFALWKKTEKGIKWESVFGEGRPGWHTECVVMINNYFHDKIDIHGGGSDLRFPHHENEVAQAKAGFKHDLANFWLYNGMLNIDGEKMSKSLGNELLAQDVVDRLGANRTRWLLLSSHYRDQLALSDELMTQSESELQRIQTALNQARVKLALADHEKADLDEEAYDDFINCLNDDLNTPNAYAVIFETIKLINQLLRVSDIDYNDLSRKTNAVAAMLEILGISFPKIELSVEDKELYAKWQTAKNAKDFDKADEYRKELTAKGIL